MKIQTLTEKHLGIEIECKNSVLKGIIVDVKFRNEKKPIAWLTFNVVYSSLNVPVDLTISLPCKVNSEDNVNLRIQDLLDSKLKIKNSLLKGVRIVVFNTKIDLFKFVYSC